MSELEENFLENSVLKPSVWWRYIDDIFMIWQHGRENLDKFLTALNSCHPSIKFKAEDVEVIPRGNQLTTDLYVKPTDSHRYLHASSCHVFH